MTTKPKTRKTSKPRTPKPDRFAELTNAFIRMMEEGAANPKGWTMPWHTIAADMPRNIVSKKAYRGINYLLTAIAAAGAGSAPLFASYDQWNERHLQVRRGEKGVLIVKYIEVNRRDKDGALVVKEDGTPETTLIPRVFTTFGIWQTDETKAGAKARVFARFGYDANGRKADADDRFGPFTADERCDAFFAAVGADVRHGGNKAGYAPSADYIVLPDPERFHTPRDYYSTKAHEHGHWTGHKDRLGREGIVEMDALFGTRKYAFEELVAELSAAFLGTMLGFTTTARQDHADYLANWIAVLNDDHKALLRAAAQAQKAVDYLAAKAGWVDDAVIADEVDEDDPTDALIAPDGFDWVLDYSMCADPTSAATPAAAPVLQLAA